MLRLVEGAVGIQGILDSGTRSRDSGSSGFREFWIPDPNREGYHAGGLTSEFRGWSPRPKTVENHLIDLFGRTAIQRPFHET